jgi:hypothetical protein
MRKKISELGIKVGETIENDSVIIEILGYDDGQRTFRANTIDLNDGELMEFTFHEHNLLRSPEYWQVYGPFTREDDYELVFVFDETEQHIICGCQHFESIERARHHWKYRTRGNEPKVDERINNWTLRKIDAFEARMKKWRAQNKKRRPAKTSKRKRRAKK